jgi:hypothetical protein
MEENLRFYRVRSPIPDEEESEFPPSDIGDLSL